MSAAPGYSSLGAGTVVNGIGTLSPWILNHLGFDLAYGTGPGSAVVQDVCTVLVYIGVAMAFRR